MPNYNAQNPPYSIFPGDVALAFSNEAPAAGTASQQFALPAYSGRGEQGRTVRWQTIYGTAPSAVNVALQVALDDVDAHYQTIDSSTNTAGEVADGERREWEVYTGEGHDEHGWKWNYGPSVGVKWGSGEMAEL